MQIYSIVLQVQTLFGFIKVKVPKDALVCLISLNYYLPEINGAQGQISKAIDKLVEVGLVVRKEYRLIAQ